MILLLERGIFPSIDFNVFAFKVWETFYFFSRGVEFFFFSRRGEVPPPPAAPPEGRPSITPKPMWRYISRSVRL